ncbi:GNAT family N-acetyltransferase [Paenisporosarcina sp. TG-14]|uniref:GNAT family N-acetyltransferase n=1 Tax=Paenisporosarcina sp. TG-14 TaxID=1231057 RepID=UPI0002F1B62F|nr:GNAT family N-acetyltransferase [Paenisporosarcina sp. TG-14]
MLTDKQLNDIETLQKQCEVHDNLQLKLNWEMLRKRELNQLDFLYYEQNKLIAFLGLYAFGSTVEVCGMVRPGERRKGHFNRLFQQGMEKAKLEKYKKILLNAPSGAQAAKTFLIQHGAFLAFTEHQMKWQAKVLEAVEGFTLRHATTDDLDMRVRLDVEAFGVLEEDAQAMESRINNDEDTDMLMIDVNNETIGKIRVKREDGEAWIYGFCILPDYQGKGIGRKVLSKVVSDQSALGYTVHLDVETKNAQALKLYESVGFKEIHAQDYYVYQNKTDYK